MDRLDPPGEDGSPKPTTHAPWKVAEVSERTEQHLVRSFAPMDNKDRRKLADSFALPRVAVTKTPDLDKIMAAQCSKSIKTNDKALARIQALNSDALGPLTELMELLNRENEEDEVPDLRDQVGYVVESAITLLGNAFAQMSALRRQKVLEEYNKELITFAQGKERETEFLKAAPDLFGSKFPRDATEHLAQLAALQKAKASTSSNSSSSFRKPPSYHSTHSRYYTPRQRPQPYSRQGKGGGGHIKKVPKGPK